MDDDEGTIVIDPAGWNPIHFDSRSWSASLPPPRLQLADAAPPGWGTCAIHSYAEALTARIRIARKPTTLEVDLDAFIKASIDNQILTEEGTSQLDIGRLARYYGIPVQAPLADLPEGCVMVASNRKAGYALGTSILSFEATPLPHTAVGSRAELDTALAYRESLCKYLDEGPVVASFLLQEHYIDPRASDEPYRLIPGRAYLTETLSTGKVIQAAHAVVLYGYYCPSGDVRSLLLLCQDNMKGAPVRHLIHPDAIMDFHIPVIDGLVFSAKPKESQDLLHPSPPPLTAEPGLWDKIRHLFMH